MNNIPFDKILFYIRTLRLYEPLFLSAIIVAAVASTYLVNLLQSSVVVVLENRNFVPILSAEFIALIVWILLSIFFRKVFVFVDTFTLKIFSSDKYSIVLNKKNADRFSGEWITQGNVFIGDDGLIVTDTHSGILLRPKLLWMGRVWKDLEAKFKVDLKEQRSWNTSDDNEEKDWLPIENKFRQILGIIFRAQSLDDYYMFEIWKVGKNIVLKPHVRISGDWYAPIYNSPIIYSISKDQSVFDFKLELKGRITKLFIKNSRKPLVFVLSSEYEISLDRKTGDLRDGTVRDIPFKDRAGMFGFRNYGNEAAVVKNLTIKPLK